MLALTHVVSGVACYLMTPNPSPTGVVVAMVGSLLPDIDHSASTLGKFLPLHWFLKHRGFTHSLLALALTMGLGAWYLSPGNALALSIGYASHLVLDCLNRQGCPLLWPAKKYYRLMSIRCGSIFEYLVAGAVVIILVVLKGGVQ